MTVADGFRANAVSASIAASFLLHPPGWTRLEPQSVSGDPTPGLEARLHDPLWLLARQWQFGEFAAEDAGSPVAVHVGSTTVPVSSWLPGDTPCLLYTSPSPRDGLLSRMPSSA